MKEPIDSCPTCLGVEDKARAEEMQEYLNENSRKKRTLREVVRWALLRQYNRQRAVKRHALSLKGVNLEISPLEERGTRGTDDE